MLKMRCFVSFALSLLCVATFACAHSSEELPAGQVVGAQTLYSYLNTVPKVHDTKSATSLALSKPHKGTLLGDPPSTALTNGMPVSGMLQPSFYAYYTYRVPAPGLDTAFVLTAMSGDPDLLLASSYYPNITKFEQGSFGGGSDSILVMKSNVTQYYIAVFAWSPSSFTMLAVTYNDSDVQQNTPITLLPGQPQTGLVLGQMYHYFYFNVTALHLELLVTLSRRFGDPDLYINGPSWTVFPSTRQYEWSSTAFGQDLLKLSMPRIGLYRIAVYGKEISEFTITAASNDAAIQLQNGVPFNGALSTGMYQYFTFFVGDSSNDLSIVLSAFTGDPDLFVKKPPVGCRGPDSMSPECQIILLNTRANATNYDYQSTNYQGDAISIPRTELYVGWYQLAVEAYPLSGNTSYSLVASTSNIWLQDGTPQTGSVAKDQSMWYQFHAAAANVNVSFSVTTITGRVGIYISPTTFPKYNDPLTYTWSNRGASPTLNIYVPAGSNRNCTQWGLCTYNILIFGTANSTYSLTAATSAATVSLINGIPVRASVRAGGYDWYAVRLQSANTALIVAVTAISGFVETFASTTDHQPTLENAMWVGYTYGEPIHVDPSDPNYKVGNYYISVYSWQDASYTITASILDLSQVSNRSVVLLNGLPQVGYLGNAYLYAYYSFRLDVDPSSKPFDVSFLLTQTYGYPYMYITNDGTTPTVDHYQWRSNWWGVDAVMVHGSCYVCEYRIAVYSYSATLFSIVATTSEGITELQSGIGVTDRVARNQYKYYTFDITTYATALVISLTSLAGDPDLYIATPYSGIVYPNATHYTYLLQADGSDVYSVTSPYIQYGSYYMGVFGYTNATYTITATVGATLLVPGEPHQDMLNGGDTRLYAVAFFPQTSTTPLVFTVDLANNGGVDMYVCASSAFYSYCNSDVPAANNPQWPMYPYNQFNASTQGTATASLTINFPSAMPYTCRNCTYYLSVVARTRTVYYVTASYGQLSTLLPAGRSISGSVQRGEYSYFRAMVNTARDDINIDVTEYVGDVGLVVSTSVHRPTMEPGRYTWIADRNHDAHGEHIAISRTDSNFHVGMYFIGIYGNQNSRFAITFTSNLRMLVPGVPQLASGSTQGTFFFVNVDQNVTTSDIIISLSPASSVSAPSDLYNIYVNNNSSMSIQPRSDAVSLWTSKQLGVGGSMVLRKADPKVSSCVTCTYYLGVVCASCSSNPLFTITVSLDSQVNQLLSNQFLTGSVTPSQFIFYQLYIAQADNVTVFVEPCVGNAVVYTSTTARMPTATTPNTIKSQTDEGVNVLSRTMAPTDTSYYLGVNSLAKFATSTYRIYAVISAPAPMAPAIKVERLTLVANDGTIGLSFQAAEPFLSTSLRYNVYVYELAADGSPAPFNMFTSCGLTSSSSKVTTTPLTSSAAQVGQTLQYSIEGLKKGANYFVNVLVEQLDSSGNPVGFAAVYRYGEIVLPSGSGSGSGSDSQSFMSSAVAKALLGVGIPVFVILLGVCVYLAVKNRRMAKELTGVELQDMPRGTVIKAVRGPRGRAEQEDKKPNKNDKPYDRLITGHESTSDEYLPPRTGTEDQDQLVEQI